ncbi:MAG TPA: tRNA (guanine-N7)-methyltransferase [Polyangiaceae bacterium]|nr:tRNA (guanine-N7)-methyltransferase [Polyangiaceae bacterium]
MPAPKPPRPYADAPRLPDATVGATDPPVAAAPPGRVDVRTLVQGAWLELEIGPGRGGFLFERAGAVPSAGLIGFEVRRKWASIVDQRLAKAGLGARARVYAEDARLALPRLHPDGSLRRVYLHFPDPWWKKRHTKRLVVQDDVVVEIARLLETGGELFIQTDVEDRAVLYESQVRACPLFAPFGDAEGSPMLEKNPYDAESPREKRAIADGLPIHRLRFRRA